MPSRPKKLAKAQYEAYILWWDLEKLAVMCPLCAEVESHSTQSKHQKIKLDTHLILTALCSSTGLTYEAFFPWQKGLGWQKDWARKRLETVGVDLSDFDVGGSFQPTTFLIAGPPLSARERCKTAKSLSGNQLLFRGQEQLRTREPKEAQREKVPNSRSTVEPEIRLPPLTPRTVLGDMTLIMSRRTKPNSIEIFAPAATIDGVIVSDPLAVISSSHRLIKKTVAILDRKGSFTPIIAVSGWNDSVSRTENRKIVLDQDLWTQQVHMLGEYVTHKLDFHNLDNGIEGRVLASHAEKQLMAFFVREHCFLEDGYEDGEMFKLKSLPPHSGLREAWIAIDNPPCSDCEAFKEKVEAVCGVKFHFVLMKRESSFKKDRRNKSVEKSRTPFRPNSRRFPLLTPPLSGSPPSKKESHYILEEDGEDEEEEEEQENELDDSVEYGDPNSPCHQRDLRSLTASRQLTTTKYALYLSGNDPAFRLQKGEKQPRSEASDETYNESNDELGYSSPSSPVRRNPPLVKRSRQSIISAPNSKRPIIDTSQTRSQGYSRHYGDNMLCAEQKRAPNNELWDSMEEQEPEEARQEEDDSTDSDTPIAMHRTGNKRATSEKIVIDLTGDTTDDSCSGEGSCFSP
jgi:hypothetical protein